LSGKAMPGRGCMPSGNCRSGTQCLDTALATAGAEVSTGSDDQMTDLPGLGVRTGPWTTIHEDGRCDTCSYRNEDEAGLRSSSAGPGLGEPAGADVMAHNHWTVRVASQESREFEVMPTEVGGPSHDTAGVLDATGHNDTDGAGLADGHFATDDRSKVLQRARSLVTAWRCLVAHVEHSAVFGNPGHLDAGAAYIDCQDLIVLIHIRLSWVGHVSPLVPSLERLCSSSAASPSELVGNRPLGCGPRFRPPIRMPDLDREPSIGGERNTSQDNRRSDEAQAAR
jgi:hypothetical protein